MKTLKFHLLTAAAMVAGFGGTAAQAQFAIGATALHGAGASLPQTVMRQAADCYGLKSPLAFGVTSGSAPASTTLFDFDFNTPAADTIGNRFNCAANSAQPAVVSPNFGAPRIVQPNVDIFYLSTGSGQGITAFLNNRLSATVVASSGFPLYTSADGYQFSNSDTALSAANVTTYNTALINPFGRYAAAATAANLFGPAIQIPLMVAPVAIAYDPVYAKERNNGGLINEYHFTVAGARADGSGGLKLTRVQYCGIVNGTITNWNQLPTTVVNKDINDPAPFNVPIRLVGRSESSGTTSLFTRAMAAQCGTTGNRFGNSEGRLPYDGVTTVAGTVYTGAAGAVSPTNSLSGAFFDKASNSITIGTEAAGLFTVANGNDGVAQAINYHPDPSSTVGDRTLNGRIGYVSPENVLPATLYNGSNNYGLNTASLQVNGTGTVFVGPDAKQASAAFAGIQPPQSKGTAGAYDATVTTSDRANPLAWVQLTDKSVSLAAPVKGYPIVGSTNGLLYTCYATTERRQAVNGFFATLMGKTPKDSNNQAFAVAFATDAVNGLMAKNGLAPLPGSWKNAITETFFKKSVQVGDTANPATSKLGDRNLWIQDKIPTAPTGAGSINNANLTICAGKPGA